MTGKTEDLARLLISSEGLKFRVFCDDGKSKVDHYLQGKLQAGTWLIQKTNDQFIVKLNGEDFYEFDLDENCFNGDIVALEFVEGPGVPGASGSVHIPWDIKKGED